MARVHVHTMREPGNHDLDRKETIRCISKAVKENVRYVPSHIPDTKMTLSSTAKSTIVRNRSNLTDQVIGIDGDHDRCWVRQWPLEPKGSPVFEVPLDQIHSESRAD